MSKSNLNQDRQDAVEAMAANICGLISVDDIQTVLMALRGLGFLSALNQEALIGILIDSRLDSTKEG